MNKNQDHRDQEPANADLIDEKIKYFKPKPGEKGHHENHDKAHVHQKNNYAKDSPAIKSSNEYRRKKKAQETNNGPKVDNKPERIVMTKEQTEIIKSKQTNGICGIFQLKDDFIRYCQNVTIGQLEDAISRDNSVLYNIPTMDTDDIVNKIIALQLFNTLEPSIKTQFPEFQMHINMLKDTKVPPILNSLISMLGDFMTNKDRFVHFGGIFTVFSMFATGALYSFPHFRDFDDVFSRQFATMNTVQNGKIFGQEHFCCDETTFMTDESIVKFATADQQVIHKIKANQKLTSDEIFSQGFDQKTFTQEKFDQEIEIFSTQISRYHSMYSHIKSLVPLRFSDQGNACQVICTDQDLTTSRYIFQDMDVFFARQFQMNRKTVFNENEHVDFRQTSRDVGIQIINSGYFK